MGVKLAASSSAKTKQGVTDYELTMPLGIILEFETEHYHRCSFLLI